MKRKMKTMFSALVLCIMFMMVLSGRNVQAAAKAPVCVKNQTVYFNGESFDGKTTVYRTLDIPSSYIYIKNLASNAKITNLKSSNSRLSVESMRDAFISKADSVHILAGQEMWKKNLSFKSGEKSKITFQVKQNGKTYNLSCNVTLKKSTSPLKNLKIGTKEYSSKLKGKRDLYMKFPASNFKLTVKPASGYAVDHIDVYFQDNSCKRVKSGVTLNGKNIQRIHILYHVTKKPANYTKPKAWIGGVLPSPLHEFVSIRVPN